MLRSFLSNSIDVHHSISVYQLFAQPSLHTVKCDDSIQLLGHVVLPVVFPCWVNVPSHTGFKQRSHLWGKTQIPRGYSSGFSVLGECTSSHTVPCSPECCFKSTFEPSKFCQFFCRTLADLCTFREPYFLSHVTA